MHSVKTIDDLKLVSGWLCLDFSNTADRINDQIAHDWLKAENDLLVWGERVGILADGGTTSTVAGEGQSVSDSLQAAHDLRELLYRVFSAIANDQNPYESNLNTFNDLLRESMSHVEISSRAEGYQWAWQGNPSPLTRIRWSVVRSAAELLTAPELRLLRQCAAGDCGWLFLDTSRNHSRRWCDMDDCGNRAKARRHCERSKNTTQKRANR